VSIRTSAYMPPRLARLASLCIDHRRNKGDLHAAHQKNWADSRSSCEIFCDPQQHRSHRGRSGGCHHSQSCCCSKCHMQRKLLLGPRIWLPRWHHIRGCGHTWQRPWYMDALRAQRLEVRARLFRRVGPTAILDLQRCPCRQLRGLRPRTCWAFEYRHSLVTADSPGRTSGRNRETAQSLRLGLDAPSAGATAVNGGVSLDPTSRTADGVGGPFCCRRVESSRPGPECRSRGWAPGGGCRPARRAQAVSAPVLGLVGGGRVVAGCE
jgi:hypothetical protein